MIRNEGTNRAIVYLPIGQVQCAPWNPPRRTRKEALAGLVASMRESGFWWYMPLILARDGTLADGHRRLEAAKVLRLTDVPCARVDKAADVLWAEINGRRRTVSSAETLEAATRGLTVLPEEHSKAVTEFLRIVGMEQAQASYMTGVSPHILAWAKKVARYVGYDGDEPMIARCVLWLRKHEMQRRVRGAMDAEVDANLLLGYVLSDAPLPPLRLTVEAQP